MLLLLCVCVCHCVSVNFFISTSPSSTWQYWLSSTGCCLIHHQTQTVFRNCSKSLFGTFLSFGIYLLNFSTHTNAHWIQFFKHTQDNPVFLRDNKKTKQTKSLVSTKLSLSPKIIIILLQPNQLIQKQKRFVISLIGNESFPKDIKTRFQNQFPFQIYFLLTEK